MSFKYFKILNKDMYTIGERPLQLEIGKTYNADEEKYGSHTLCFYKSMNMPHALNEVKNPRFFEISITGKPVKQYLYNEYTSKTITIIREIPIPEIRKEARKINNLFCKQILCTYGTSKDLDVLVHDTDYHIRTMIARKNIGKYLDILIRDENPHIRHIVLTHKRVNDIKTALSDPDSDVRRYATEYALEKHTFTKDIIARTVCIDGKSMSLEKAHRLLWTELSETKGMTKDDFFEKHTTDFIPINLCFACDICSCNCVHCPIEIWQKFACMHGSNAACSSRLQNNDSTYNGLFRQWCDAIDNKRCTEACEIAKRIAKLKWSIID